MAARTMWSGNASELLRVAAYPSSDDASGPVAKISSSNSADLLVAQWSGKKKRFRKIMGFIRCCQQSEICSRAPTFHCDSRIGVYIMCSRLPYFDATVFVIGWLG